MKKLSIWQKLFGLSDEENELFKDKFANEFDRKLWCFCWVVIFRPYLRLTTYEPKWVQEMNARQKEEEQRRFNEMFKIAYKQTRKSE